jgi:hypothetical protein
MFWKILIVTNTIKNEYIIIAATVNTNFNLILAYNENVNYTKEA